MEKPKLHVVSFSGGKDSTAMLLRMLEEGMRVDLILYCDTGLEFPEMEEHVRKVETYIGREITRIKAERDFLFMASEHEYVLKSDKVEGYKPGDVLKGAGWPRVFGRWCTRYLKIDVINRYLRELRKDYDVEEYIGIAADEQHRTKENGLNYPLIDWDMTEADCLTYCYDRGFTWGGLYEIWDRVSCWCCPLQSLDDLRKLRHHRPGLWEKLREMDERISKTKYPNFRFYESFTDIDRRFEVEDEFIAEGKKIRTKEFFAALDERGINRR